MYSNHCHTGKSNASRGFPDSSIKLEDMVLRAKELGLSGLSITDHETVGGFIEAKNLEKKHDFPVICGNEIYLVSDGQYEALKNDYKDGMYFPHFILIAKDKIGAFQLIQLSTIAWTNNSFMSRGLMRTPTKMSDIEKVIGDNKGHIIATSACLGGSIPRWILSKKDNPERMELLDNAIENLINWCQDIFGKDSFYLECQPAIETQIDQLYVNDEIKKLSKKYNVPYTIATDAHYLKKELLAIHGKFLNSKETDDREVESFYRTAYLMSEDEVREYFSPYWSEEDIKLGINNTIKIGESCERYDFNRKQVVPEVEFEKDWKINLDYTLFPIDKEYIQKTLNSEHMPDRYLMYKLQQGIEKFIPQDEYEATFEKIEEELNEIWHISEQLNDRLGNYFITMSKIIEIMWDRNGGDSLVGVGRGSGVASILDYLLEITQVNPIKMPVELPFYRFMAKERAELPDLDIDTQSNRRAQIFNAVKRYFEGLGGDVVNCCTYGKYGSKSAIKTAGRGLGLSSDDCNAIASLIPSIRGFTLSIDECYYGNEEKGLEPITQFVNTVNKHEGLLETAKMIEGVYTSRGVHASGVFITNTEFTNFSAKMVSPKGIITSQWDLHESEQAGLLKYDFLTVSALDKIRLTLEHLIANGYIEKESTLKETYLKHFNTNELDYDYPEAWAKIHNNEVSDLFQFDSLVAMDAVSKIKPSSLIELMQTNSLMRLQQQEGATETPVETYRRFKNDMSEWDRELDDWKVPQNERVFIKQVLDVFKGVADTQESMMSLVRHQNISDFDVKESHMIRKSVAKKSPKDLAICKDLFYSKGKGKVSQATLDYLWNVQIMRQASYAFSILHTLAYTFIALIELTLYTKYPSIYWNCACLTVNAEAIDENEFDVDDEEEDIWQSNSNIDDEEEKEDEEETTQVVKSKSTDYGKVASAIAKMQTRGVNIVLPDINEANLSFYPDEKNDRIIFGLKGLVGINDQMVKDIIDNRPYNSLVDFHNKLTLITREITNKTGKTQNKALVPMGKVYNLIKAGCFDSIENISRVETMRNYINMTNPPKTNMTLANINKIVEYGIVPEELSLEVRYHRFKSFISNKKNIVKDDEKTKSKKWYQIKGDNDSITAMSTLFFEEHFISELKEDVDYYYNENGNVVILSGADTCGFDKLIKEKTTSLRNWLNSEDCINRFNDITFRELWGKQVGSDCISKWEMESVGFYYNEHELKHIDKEKYSIVNYFDLPNDPPIIGYTEWKDFKYPKYEIHRICGTVVGRDKTKHLITLLTPEGSVNVKFDSGSFSHYDKQISYLGNDGKKVTLENSWFRRGNKLLICGYKLNDRFKPKKYRDSPWTHTVMLIEDIKESGDILIKQERSRV